MSDYKSRVLEKFFQNSLSSQSPSKETYNRNYLNSSVYYKNLEKELLERYEGYDFSDFKGVKEINTDYGNSLEITNKYDINSTHTIFQIIEIQSKQIDMLFDMIKNMSSGDKLFHNDFIKLSNKVYEIISNIKKIK